jgi:hypothetical protein
MNKNGNTTVPAPDGAIVDSSGNQEADGGCESDGNGGKPSLPLELTPAQEIAVAALLAGEPYKCAAEKAGVDVATLFRWGRVPGFAAEFKRRQEELREELTTKLLSLGWDACETLRVALNNSDSAPAQVAAAKMILNALGVLDGRH